jgi:hypothetical protein
MHAFEFAMDYILKKKATHPETLKIETLLII